MKRVIRWGVLGTARIARSQFLPALRQVEGAHLQIVASRSLDKAQAVAESYGAECAYGEYEDLLEDASVDAVYIPLPNDMHARWTMLALRAGKHVLCEKPLAMSAAEAEQMQDTAQAVHRTLLEAFAYRFTPTMLRATEIARSGILGELRALHADFHFNLGQRQPDEYRLNPAQGGGALYDVGCYCVNALRMLAGREPQSASCSWTLSNEYGVDMSATANLDWGDGLTGTFSVAMDQPARTYLRAEGAEGVLELPNGFALGEGEGVIELRRGGELERLVLPGVNPFVEEIRDMTDALLTGARPRFGDEPVAANMRALDACLRSARSGRREPV